MNYAVILGSDMYVGTNGILTVEIDGKPKEFLNVREIYRQRSEGSYLTLDCDIKDSSNNREVKLFKSRPVAKDDNIKIISENNSVTAERSDGSLIIKVEQLNPNDDSLPTSGPIPEFLKKNAIDAILRITGDFYAGPFHLIVDKKCLKVGGLTSSGNLLIGTGGLRLSQMGFSM